MGAFHRYSLSHVPVSGLPVWLSIVLIGVICVIYTSLVSSSFVCPTRAYFA